MELMVQLHNCEPHFVRCLVPNTHKKPGEVGHYIIIIYNIVVIVIVIVIAVSRCFVIINIFI